MRLPLFTCPAQFAAPSQETIYGARFCEFYGIHRVCGTRLPCNCQHKRRRQGAQISHVDFDLLMQLND